MPTVEIGSETVRREFADLTHRIMTGDERFLVQYYGRPVAYIGPAEIPELAEMAAAYVALGQPNDLVEAQRLLRRISGAPADAARRSPDHL